MSVKKIVVLGTGGTIAGKAARAGDNVGYKAGELGVGELLSGIPGLENAAKGRELQCEQVAQLDSKDMNFGVWRDLALRCASLMQDVSVQGVVITHGTDTLEETAWFLQSVLRTIKPIVLTSAMRPASALTPDGPQNLLDAIAVVLHPQSAGVLAVAAGVIHGAQSVHKAFPYRVDAFSSGEIGPLGWVEEGDVRWARTAPPSDDVAPHAGLVALLPPPEQWPWVEILVSGAGASARAVDALVQAGVRGLVVAATGNGSLHVELKEALMRAQASGVRVVKSTRCSQGHRIVGDTGDFAAYPGLSPVKARVSLMLDLMAA